MSDWKLPDLPSDEELGITEEDRKEYGEDLPDDGPEMSAEERAALLGDSHGRAPARPGGAGQGAGKAGGSGAAGGEKDAQRQAKEVKRQAKEAKKQAKEDRKRARAEKKEAAKRARAEKKEAAKRAREQAVVKGGAPVGAKGSVRAGSKDGAPVGEKDRAPPGSPPASSGGPGASGSGEGRAGGNGGSGDGSGGRTGSGEAPGPAARTRWRGPVTLVLLLVTAVVASTRTGLPRPIPANAADTLFSSARAMSTLVEIAREAHPTGSPEHERVRALLVERLRSLGLEPNVQTTTSLTERPGYARAATVRNVVARLPGTDPTGTLLATAHYDSRVLSTGAGDDGSGVVTILEALRALRAAGPLRNDLIVLFTDAEELGLLGARAFVDRHPLMSDVDLVLSFEMRGSGGPSIMFETNELNGWVVRAMQEWEPKPYANSMAYEVYRRMPNDTDFTPFRESGVQGLNFAAIDNAHVYHQAYDTPENLSESTLQDHGLQALGALRHFGAADLRAVNASDVVYFSIPGLGLVVYGEGWVLPISLALLVLFGLLLVAARRAGARPGGMTGGLGIAVLASALSFALGWAFMRWVPRMHAEFGALDGGAFHSEGWYMLALAFAVLGIVTGLTSLARRWMTLVELAVGASVLPLLAAVVASFVAPLAAMNLQWPVASAVLAAILVALLGRRAEGAIGWIVALLLAVPVLVVLQPVVEMVWLGMSLRLAGVLATMMATALLLCLPALSALRHPNAWWAPLTGLGVAAAMMGIGLAAGRPSAERPAPSTLLYAYEHGTGDALWVTAPADAGAPAREWAAERASAAFEERRDLAAFGYSFGEVPVAPAPVVQAQPPSVTVVGDTLFSGARLVVMHVRSRLGAELLQFQIDEETRVNAINGLALADPGALRRLDHWGRPQDHVVLELSMPPEAPIGIHVVEHLLRPEEILGRTAFQRPPRLAPNTARWSDRALFRYSVADFADPRHAIVPVRPPDAAESIPSDILTPPPNTGVPADTLIIRRDTLTRDVEPSDTVDTVDTVPADTGAEDTLPRDTVAADTVLRDTITKDTVPRDTITEDTVPRDTATEDTLARDTVTRDTIARDALPRDTLGHSLPKER